MEDRGSQWLSYFPESGTSLVTLNIACLKGEVNAGALERLVSRSPNLRSLRLNHSVSLEALAKILAYDKLYGLFHNCQSLRSMSGFWNVAPDCLPALYPICSNFTVLNLIYVLISYVSALIKLIQQCSKRSVFLSILKELKVFPGDHFGGVANVTEEGLVSIYC